MNALMVDDHEMFLQGLQRVIEMMAPTLHVDTAIDLDAAVQHSQTTPYELVLLDWHLADCDGAHAIRRLRAAGSRARIVVLSGESTSTMVRNALDVGAAGFIPKAYSSQNMIGALERVLAGGIYLPAQAQDGASAYGRAPVDPDPRLNLLTDRQRDAYHAAARGLSNKLVAREMGIAESTVKSHLSAVYAVLGVRNRTEALYLASRDGTRIV